MSSTIQPLTLYGRDGPHPPKVAMLLTLLSIPHTTNPISFADVKSPAFLAINPNGRMPALHDPNTDITIWESGAIIEYLVETYDKERKLSFERGSKEDWMARQWLYFQVSGQGPYFGQVVWVCFFFSRGQFVCFYIVTSMHTHPAEASGSKALTRTYSLPSSKPTTPSTSPVP